MLGLCGPARREIKARQPSTTCIHYTGIRYRDFWCGFGIPKSFQQNLLGQQYRDLVIHSTQVMSTRSVPIIDGRGGLSSDTGRVVGTVQQRAGLPGVPVPVALAGGVPVSALRHGQGMAATFRPLAVLRLRSSDGWPTQAFCWLEWGSSSV